MKLQLILEIYAVMCLAGLPLVLAVTIYLYKKTDVIDRIDEWLDSFLGVSGNAEEGKKHTPSELKSPERKEDSGEEDCREVPRFILTVGETYQLWRSKKQYQMNVHSEWEAGHPFIGKVEDQSVFTALRTGVCQMLFDGVVEYEIEIIPRRSSEFLDTDMKDICKGLPMASLKSRMMPKAVLQSDTGNLPLIYRAPFEGVRTASYVRSGDTLSMAAYELDSSILDIDGMLALMDERFKRIGSVSESEAYFWYHQNEEDEVDGVAFLHGTGSRLLLGLSAAWRTGMDAAEAKMNIGMIERRFSLLSDMEPAEVALSESEMDSISGRDVPAGNPISDAQVTEKTTCSPENMETGELDENSQGQFDPRPAMTDEVEAEKETESGGTPDVSDIGDDEGNGDSDGILEEMDVREEDPEEAAEYYDIPTEIEIPDFEF